MRWLAGSFDPSGRADSARLSTALAPHGASIIEQGPLRVAFSGSRARSSAPLCLLDGHLDNPAAIAESFDGAMPSTSEQVVAIGWRRWGHDLLPRLRGDFALLVWDRERSEGLLARDQLGVRSLYLFELNGALLFANEVRHLLALLPRRPAPDPVGVAHWIAGSGRPGPGTLYAGIRRLEPGGVVRFGPSGIREELYWTPRFQAPVDAAGSDVSGVVREAIDLAVKRRLSRSGVTGVLMSGGLDSATVAAVASAHAPDSVAAYCGVFPEHRAVDESELIDQLRGSLRLPGVIAAVRAGGLLGSALESQRAWESPLLSWGDFWALPLLREAASAGVAIMLGGDGGDELFAVRSYLIADELSAGRPREALALLRRLPGAAYGPSPREMGTAVRNLALGGALPYGLHRALSRPFAGRAHPGWLRSQTRKDLRASEDPLAWKRLDGPRWWARAAHVVMRGVEELGVFEALRRTAMLAGLEARHPLFDLDLIELVLRTPPRASFDARLDRPLLRASMDGQLPDVVRLRGPKALFDSLISDSLLGSDRALVEAILASPAAELRAFVDLDAARGALLESPAGRLTHPFQSTQHLWRLITAECWLKAHADPGRSVLPAGALTSQARVSLTRTPRQPSASASRTAG
jgi:asparagine synthase (glutamine-hydrolysing)